MASTYTPTATWVDTYQIPGDGDHITAASVNTALEALGDRSEHTADRVDAVEVLGRADSLVMLNDNGINSMDGVDASYRTIGTTLTVPTPPNNAYIKVTACFSYSVIDATTASPINFEFVLHETRPAGSNLDIPGAYAKLVHYGDVNTLSSWHVTLVGLFQNTEGDGEDFTISLRGKSDTANAGMQSSTSQLTMIAETWVNQ
jgi:hypothetical protein